MYRGTGFLQLFPFPADPGRPPAIAIVVVVAAPISSAWLRVWFRAVMTIANWLVQGFYLYTNESGSEAVSVAPGDKDYLNRRLGLNNALQSVVWRSCGCPSA